MFHYRLIFAILHLLACLCFRKVDGISNNHHHHHWDNITEHKTVAHRIGNRAYQDNLCNENHKGQHDGMIICIPIVGIVPFLRSSLPDIRNYFVLISLDGDESMPTGAGLSQRDFVKILRHDKLLHWYSQNCDTSSHVYPQKFSCLPLGLSGQDGDLWNWKMYMHRAYESRWGLIGGLYQDLSDHRNISLVAKNGQGDSKYWLLAAFSIRANPRERKPPYLMSCGTPEATDQSDGINVGSLTNISYCFTDDAYEHVKNYTEYYHALSRTRFAWSPHGNGLDCHRTWEILLLGAYPIVKTSSLDELYRDLPVLVVEEVKLATLKPFTECYL